MCDLCVYGQHVVEGDDDSLYIDGQLICSVKDGKVGTVQSGHDGRVCA